MTNGDKMFRKALKRKARMDKVLHNNMRSIRSEVMKRAHKAYRQCVKNGAMAMTWGEVLKSAWRLVKQLRQALLIAYNIGEETLYYTMNDLQAAQIKMKRNVNDITQWAFRILEKMRKASPCAPIKYFEAYSAVF